MTSASRSTLIVRPAFAVALAFALQMSGASRVALAQAPSPPRSVAALADSIAAAGDTTRAYALLDSALHRNDRDGAAWLQFGLLNWNMAKSKRRPGFISDQRTIRLLRGADTALRMATKVSPDSARYWLTLGRFNLSSGVSTMRFAAAGEVGSALDAARKSGDSLLMAVAADEAGMATWRRYETVANRGLLSDGRQSIQIQNSETFSRSKARDLIDNLAHKITPPTGQGDYAEAFDRFSIAMKADPTTQRHSRHLFMAFGEHGRWNELLDEATRLARAYPLDYQARLAQGLAQHRLGNERQAQLAFDSAFALMDDPEQAHLSKFTRILRPKPLKETKGTIGDTLAFTKLPVEQQRGFEQMYWLMNDPLAFTSENEFRLEFLSRVVWSDFRWTSEDLNLRGADTDRGDIYVRYGPPDLEMTVPGNSNPNANVGEAGVTLVWAYRNGLVFFFDLKPGFGSAQIAFVDQDDVDHIKSSVPVSFDNVPSAKLIDTIPIRIARFRAGADSSDAVIATRLPLDSLVRGLGMSTVPVDLDFRIFDQFVRIRGVESEQRKVRPDSLASSVARVWTRRLGPGINVVRIEAMQLDSKRAARAMSRVDPEVRAGFGMSDILLGNKPAPRDGSAPRRWTDVAMTPNLGIYARGTSMGLLWEMYDLAASGGSSKYRVAIEVQRTDRTAIGAFTARLVDGVGRAVGREQVSRDKLTISFDRSAASANTLVEFLSLDLADSANGTYRLRVEITDQASGKKTSRQADFIVR